MLDKRLDFYLGTVEAESLRLEESLLGSCETFY